MRRWRSVNLFPLPNAILHFYCGGPRAHPLTDAPECSLSGGRADTRCHAELLEGDKGPLGAIPKLYHESWDTRIWR